MGAFVGIDLGTTFSVVATINSEGRPVAIPNEYGRFVNPSVVYLGPGGPIVGDEAKELQATGATEVACFFKRHVGDPYFELAYQGRSYTPTDLSALVLEHLKGIAEQFLKQPVTHAVITVPAYFNNMQREATIQAGRQAGLEVLSIISEPTSAALAYGMRSTEGVETVLVYDLGGGTFDVSVVEITDQEQRVLGTGGDHHLGGKDWDDRVLTYLVQSFEDQYGDDLVEDEFNELLVVAENAKKSLSARQSVDVRVQAGAHRATYSLSRERFEDLSSDLMARTERLTEQVLEDINLTWEDLTKVLLVGGSTRMPMVRAYVQRMSGRPPMTDVNPDEAVALGAAIQAAMDMEQEGAQAKPILSLAGRKRSVDVISHSLGMIAIKEDRSRYINSIIIQKNQPIPTCQTRPYTLKVSRQGDSRLEVFMTQGESAEPMDCAYLGKYVFSNIPPIADRTAVLDITYAYDRNGVVNVTAMERSSKQNLIVSVEPLPHDIPDRFMLPPEQETVREHMTVYLAFDLSGSMSGAPLTEAQKAAHAFVSQCDLTNTSVGLISFSDRVHIETAACQNAKTIARAINGLSIGRTGYGNATDPFREIYNEMHRVGGLKYALVLADGVWAYQDKAVKRARTCHQEGIEVIGIGFGAADREFLRQISSSDENSFFTDMSALAETFSSIAQELTEGARLPAKSRVRGPR